MILVGSYFYTRAHLHFFQTDRFHINRKVVIPVTREHLPYAMPFEGKRFWKGFWQLADPKIWIASTVPMVIGAGLAYSKLGYLDIPWLLLAFVGVYLIEIGKNAVNEFFDYISGADRFVEKHERTPFSGGKKTIIEGKLSLIETGVIAVVTLALAFFIGLFIALEREPNIFWIGMAGGLIAIAYTFPPFKLCYRGLGEIVIGIAFGPLVISGMYLMLTHTLTWDIVFVGIPVGFLIMCVIWINEYPDYEADRKAGKRNLVVRLGREKGIAVYAVLYAAAFVSLIVLAFVYRNPLWLLGLAGVPLAIQSVKIARLYHNDIQRLMTANGRTVQVYQIVGLAMLIAAIFNF